MGKCIPDPLQIREPMSFFFLNSAKKRRKCADRVGPL